MKISDLVIDLLTHNPDWDNEQVAAEVQKRVPGATTSAASVSSIKSNAKKLGLLKTTERAVTSVAETFVDLPQETFEQRSARIRNRYNTLERMAHRVASGGIPALIVSGPPGLGKSHTIETVMKERELMDASTLTAEDIAQYSDADQPMFDSISGAITAPGLIISLWNMRKKGCVLLLDDTDDVFRDETCLNILKAVLDSSEKRRVSYRKRASWMDEMGIPTSFEFEGTVVFCTNIDFELAIRKGSAMGPHFQALIDRSLYLGLGMRCVEDYIARIRHVALEDGMLTKGGLTQTQAEEIVTFVTDNADRFYGLSLRLIHQIAICYKADHANWKEDVECTKMRTL